MIAAFTFTDASRKGLTDVISSPIAVQHAERVSSVPVVPETNCPMMCSLSSTTTCPTSAAPTAIQARATRSSMKGYAASHDQGEVEIVVYNRAVLLFRTDSEAVRRIHRVCSQ